MPSLSRATLWMHQNQILTQHLTFPCGNMTLQHSTPYNASLNKPVVDSNCVLRILLQLFLNCKLSAERHLFKPLLLVFPPCETLTRVFYRTSLGKIGKCMGNLGFAAVCLSHYFCWFVWEPLGCGAIQHIKQQSVIKQNPLLSKHWIKSKADLCFLFTVLWSSSLVLILNFQ